MVVENLLLFRFIQVTTPKAYICITITLIYRGLIRFFLRWHILDDL